MGQPAPLAITVHDYMAMPDGPPYHQLVDGELFMSPSTSWRHQDLVGRIYATIAGHLEKNDIGQVFIAPLDVVLSEINVYQPDILYFSHRRKGILGERCIEGAPDFVVEVLSPSTARLDKGHKRKIYAQTGVKELWFVDPETIEISIFDLKQSLDIPVGVYSGNNIFSTATFPRLKFSCAKIFRSV